MVLEVRKYLLSVIIYIFVPVFFGALMYYIFCPEVYFVKEIDILLGLNRWPICIPTSNMLMKMLRNYLMDFLWAYALMSLVLIFFSELGLRKLVILIIGFEIFMELLQLHPSIGGTYDIFDILVEIVANILAIIIIQKKEKSI